MTAPPRPEWLLSDWKEWQYDRLWTKSSIDEVRAYIEHLERTIERLEAQQHGHP